MPVTEIRIRKADGELVPYDRDKLMRSLHRSGATDEAITRVVDLIEADLTDGQSTRLIYKNAFRHLRKTSVGAASQYKLKQAVMELGPSGYPFEKFVGALFASSGWNVRCGIILPGRCVTHEVDVQAWDERVMRFTECKFRNTPGSKVDVKVVLYVHSRVRDLEARHRDDHPDARFRYEGWVATNGKFTTDAEQYARCAGLNLLAWDYPEGQGLLQLIRQSGLKPLTVLHGLTHKQKELVMQGGTVLVRDVLARPEVLDLAGVDAKTKAAVLKEAEEATA